MGSSSSAGSEPWVSATGQFPRAHLGKMGLRNVRSAPCAASASTKSWFLAKRTCGEFSSPMRRTTTKRARTWRYRRMLLNIGRSSETELLSPYPFCRVFIIDTHGYDFRKGQHCSDHQPTSLVANNPTFGFTLLGVCHR